MITMVKLKKSKFRILVCAISCMLSMNPYFLWETFGGGVLRYPSYGLYIVSAYYMISSRKTDKKFTIKKEHGLLLVALILIYAITYLHVYGGVSFQQALGGICLFVYLFSIIIADEQMQRDVFDTFTKVLIITLIPGLIYYILELFGVSLSIGTIYSQNQLNYQKSVEYTMMSDNTSFYKLYIGAVMRVNTNTRFSGIYDEAGLVGTVTALCLVARGFKLKNNRTNTLLLICNLITFSLAGYILIFIYFILKWIRKSQWKLVAGGIAFGIGFYFLLNTTINLAPLTFLQNRFLRGNGILSIVNNRETSHFDVGYMQLKNSGILTQLIGFGRGADLANVYMNGSSSYRCLIYNYGYVGFTVMMLTLLYSVRKYLRKIWNHWPQFSLILIFAISIYQRPSVFSPYYFIILLGGCSYLQRKYIAKEQKVRYANASNQVRVPAPRG